MLLKQLPYKDFATFVGELERSRPVLKPTIDLKNSS